MKDDCNYMKDYLYKEVYVVGADNQLTVTGELNLYLSFEDLLAYLKTKNVSINSDLRVLHGVLTPAKIIPKDLKDRQPFIILQDSMIYDQGIIIDSDNNYDELAQEIEEALSNEETAQYFFEIDNVFILYGYEISLTLSADEDDIDESIIADCLLISDNAKKLDKENN